MSDTTLLPAVENLSSAERERNTAHRKSSEANRSRVQKVWCAPMSDAGEWVITWTGVPGARCYELQTSSDASNWGNDSKFSGTRAVLILGPAQLCWVRVRAVGPRGPGAWSQPVRGAKDPQTT